MDENSIGLQVNGFYRRCPVCQAFIASPLPAGWTITLSRDGETNYITPHLPDCEQGAVNG